MPTPYRSARLRVSFRSFAYFSLSRFSTCSQARQRAQGCTLVFRAAFSGLHGPKTHHLFLAILEEAHYVVHAWLCSGTTGVSSGVANFLKEFLALLPKGWKARCVRANSGHFTCKMPGLLEERFSHTLLSPDSRREVSGARLDSWNLNEWTQITKLQSFSASFRAGTKSAVLW